MKKGGGLRKGNQGYLSFAEEIRQTLLWWIKIYPYFHNFHEHSIISCLPYSCRGNFSLLSSNSDTFQTTRMCIVLLIDNFFAAKWHWQRRASLPWLCVDQPTEWDKQITPFFYEYLLEWANCSHFTIGNRIFLNNLSKSYWLVLACAIQPQPKLVVTCFNSIEIDRTKVTSEPLQKRSVRALANIKRSGFDVTTKKSAAKFPSGWRDFATVTEAHHEYFRHEITRKLVVSLYNGNLFTQQLSNSDGTLINNFNLFILEEMKWQLMLNFRKIHYR
jgi:hypothetical protein